MEGEKWMEIRNDRLKGMSYTELGRKYHIDPRTAKRYAESPQRPEYTLSAPKANKAGCVQAAGGSVAGGSAVLGSPDIGETQGAGF